MPRSLYICYFGLTEPLVQTQVLPYLREIRKGGTDVSLLTFEPDYKSKWSPDRLESQRRELAAEGIAWHSLAYHKSPSVPATLYDILRGTLFIRQFIAREKPDILHGRVHLPTLMGALARKLSRHRPKLLFDIRGFFPEEYTDAGIWPEGGWLYRGAKRVERWLMKESDGFVVLTEKARDILFPESRETGLDKLGRPVEVIPCCVDFVKRFRLHHSNGSNRIREELGLNERFVVTHVGALVGLYLADKIADFVKTAKELEPSTYALFLTQTPIDNVASLLRSRGLTKNDFFVGLVSASEVQEYMEACDVALSFVRAGYATASRSPTKIPEYLAAGLPIIANAGVGDVDDLIRQNQVGVIVDSLDEHGFRSALARVKELGEISRRCRETAVENFDLESIGGVRYRRLYDRLLNNATYWPGEIAESGR